MPRTLTEGAAPIIRKAPRRLATETVFWPLEITLLAIMAAVLVGKRIFGYLFCDDVEVMKFLQDSPSFFVDTGWL